MTPAPGPAAGRDAPLEMRDGRVADAEAVEAVHWRALEATYLGRVPGWPVSPRDVDARVARWREWLAAEPIDMVLGEVGGVLVGFCALRPGTDPDVDPALTGEVPTLYVAPDRWGRGYGRRLCTEALRRAGARGFESVVLWVVDVNERARAFYRRLGFTPDGRRKAGADAPDGAAASRYGIPVKEEWGADDPALGSDSGSDSGPHSGPDSGPDSGPGPG